MSSNLWQLRRLSTNENLNEPQPLPKDWGPIFGLEGFVDKIGDLSWLGDPEYADKGWFDTGIPTPPPPLALEDNKEEKVKSISRTLLAQSDWAMMPDVPMTFGEKQKWEVYRKALREIKLQPGYPDDIIWPSKP